ncbi:MAG: XRE family transcriptional regulator [Brevundimonas sp.]
MSRQRYDLISNLEPRGLNRIAASQYIGVSTGKFDQMVADGRMPAAKQIDGRKVWDKRALDEAFSALPGQRDVSEPNPWDVAA